jgi:chemotaxis protein methyltransferase CheR
LAIHCEDQSQIRLINVISLTGQEKELEYLKLLLSQEGFKHREIYFYDIEILSAKAVDLLSYYIKSTELKIYVQKRYLRDYLIKLGIYTTLIQNTQKSNQEIIDLINKNIRLYFLWDDVLPLLENVYHQFGYDFRNYKPDSITRRVNSHVYKEKNMTLKEFTQYSMTNEEALNEILSALTVKTTEFFRDAQVYETLRNRTLNYLNSYASIKIWCAGCSTGEEAYSIAVLLEEVGLLEKSLIYATDLSFNNIQQAKNGLYSTEEIEKGVKNHIDSGGRGNFRSCFTDHGTYAEIKSKYKDHILFFQHSLVESGIVNEFQLILCRNVLMYFNNQLQEKTLKLLYESLDRSGFLVLGKSEGILSNDGCRYFIESDAKNRIYKKKS